MAVGAASDGRDSASIDRTKLTAGLLGLLAVGLLLVLAGFTLASSAVMSVVALPLLVIFSPVVVPGAIVIAAATLAFGACGAAGLGGLWALRWAVGRVKGGGGDRSGWARTVGQAGPGHDGGGPQGEGAGAGRWRERSASEESVRCH